MKEVLNIIKYSYKVEFDEDANHYHRFVTHLKFCAQRILNHTEEKDDNVEIFEVFKNGESFKSMKGADLKEINERNDYLKVMTGRVVAEAKIMCVKEGKCEFEDKGNEEKDDYIKNSDVSDFPSDIEFEDNEENNDK